ncbi:hypothetical protein SUGI_0104840 [Cryptomeria japonica]|uniref:uncharacterized protein LOC131047429 n=1 Tax=Cryptomeria japonica TaxID=3369 RepID=UPI002408BA9E|nr:uncharacterized protein LOC131047429 [Cryptomeria japonica]GLJ09257.1 hypothetical protein SUGI_0104840 [Cryptomeria japonica]
MKRTAEDGKEEINGEGKRGRTESDVEDFFALLERIRQAEKQLGVEQKFRRPEAPAVMSKPAWHLSFEWEDFSGARHADPKEGLGLENGNRNCNICPKWRPVCVDPKKGNREMLDLNLPSNFY